MDAGVNAPSCVPFSPLGATKLFTESCPAVVILLPSQSLFKKVITHVPLGAGTVVAD